ncbi:MAG TPA: CRTAC1 family protein [Candidatus Limnocylindrales bacterium]|nr:CRTAC1 family protein [Candidatus Limnocylindrales bacterium]
MTRGRRMAVVVVALVALAAAGVGAWSLGVGRPPVPGPALGPPRFVDETATSGIAQTYDGPLAFFVGGGVAVFDCDGDGRPDVFVAGGTNAAVLYRNDGPIGGALHFTAIHAATTDLSSVHGAYPLDIDGDGQVDLAVLRDGENVLLRGVGDCRFERANERWSFDGGQAPTTAFSATWEGSATLPTMAFGNYVNPTAEGVSDLCVDNVLLRPAATRGGYDPAVPLTPSWCALSMLFSDWDRSGRRDLRVSNDQHYYVDGEEQLWRMDPGVPPRLYTGDEGWVRVNVEGMGIGSYDLTGDGYPEVFLTSQGENRLQTLTSGPSEPRYRDIALKRGVSADRPFAGGDPLPSTAWHPEFKDVNNDGWIDLFISKGNVREQEGYALRDPSNLLLGQPDGTFRESADTAGILDYDRGRGAALADFNLDGLLDLVEVHLGTPVKVWRNVGAGDASTPAALGHWLALRITQPGANHDAIGGWLETRVGETIIRRELTVGGGHGGGQLGWVHVGLGNAGDADVRVVWPDGQTGSWVHVVADTFLDLDRAGAGARPWTPTVP